MSTSKHIDKIIIAVTALMLVLTILFICGEKLGLKAVSDEEGSGFFSQKDLLSDWDTSDATKITLADNDSVISGNDAYFKDGDVHISCAGKYVVSGSLSNGKIVIDANGDDEIRLMLSNVNISCEDSAAILVEQAGKVFLTLEDGSENVISSGEVYSEEAENSGIDGAIYSRDDLTVNGGGTLNVSGEYSHGIVCNDSLKIAGGNISITAAEDSIHANDCVCIRDAKIHLKSGDDGITVSNDDRSGYMYIESGDIKIEGCYEGLEAATVTVAGGNIDISAVDDGINGEELIEITGGSTRIVNENGRDADGLDSNGDIVISGGKLFISVSESGGNCALDYGSENQGECRIDGGTVIACGSNVMLEPISTNSAQAFIMKSVSGHANTTLSLQSSDGTQLISETIPAGFSTVTISTPELKNNDVCKLTVGDSSQDIIVDSKPETDGGIGAGGPGDVSGVPGEEEAPPEKPDGSAQPGGGTPPEKPDGGAKPGGGTPPEKPDGSAQPGGGTPPEKPDGSAQPGGGTPPEKPEGSTQ